MPVQVSAAALRQYAVCAQILAIEVEADPEPATSQLFHHIKNRQFPPSHSVTEPAGFPPSTVERSSYPLPDRPPLLVGRDEELAILAEKLIDPAVRLVTLVGPGGIGKSSAALWATRELSSRFRDGVAMVLLADTPTLSEAPITILRNLGLESRADSSPQAQLFTHLGEKQLLLILDNFEHLLPDTNLVVDLLRSCPHLTLLVTSRERLGLTGEWLLPLEALTYPAAAPKPDPDQSTAAWYSALELFQVCARRLQPAFRIDARNFDDVAHICRMVDGLPLAVEMAASWIRAVPVAVIAHEIQSNQGFLISTSRDRPARHHSIEAVLDHSWEMLSSGERSRLCQLTDFRGGFCVDAAAFVAGATPFHLLRLVDTSWIALSKSGRYSMHNLAQQYASEKARTYAVDRDEESYENVRLRHAQYYASHPVGKYAWHFSPTISEVRATITAELDNFTVAFRFALDYHCWAVVDALADSLWIAAYNWWSPEMEDLLSLAVSTLQRALNTQQEAHAVIEMALAKVLCTKGELINLTGEVQQSIALLTECRDILMRQSQSSGAPATLLPYVNTTLGNFHHDLGEFATARRYLDEALASYELDENAPGQRRAQLYLLLLLDRVGEFQRAEELACRIFGPTPSVPSAKRAGAERAYARILAQQGKYDEAWHILVDALGFTSSRWRSHALLQMGIVARGKGNNGQASQLLHEGLAIAREADDRPAMSDILAELGRTQLKMGDQERAGRHFAQSLQIAEEIDRARTIVVAQTGLGRVATAAGAFDLARTYFRKTVARNWEMGTLPDLMDALVGVAELALAEGRPDLAMDLLLPAETHCTAPHETRQQAQALRTAVYHPRTSQITKTTDERDSADLNRIVSAVEHYLRDSH